jgi:hypothetical protein
MAAIACLFNWILRYFACTRAWAACDDGIDFSDVTCHSPSAEAEADCPLVPAGNGIDFAAISALRTFAFSSRPEASVRRIPAGETAKAPMARPAKTIISHQLRVKNCEDFLG